MQTPPPTKKSGTLAVNPAIYPTTRDGIDNHSEMVWANDQSPTKSPSKRTPGRPGTPGTPGTPRRAGTLALAQWWSYNADHACRAGTPEAGSTLVNPSSALLQDLLKEQRACRGVRASTEEMDAQVPRTPDRPFARSRSQSQSQSQSQDDTSDKQKRVNSALSAGLRQPREMGVREMDQVGCSVIYVVDVQTDHYSRSTYPR